MIHHEVRRAPSGAAVHVQVNPPTDAHIFAALGEPQAAPAPPAPSGEPPVLTPAEIEDAAQQVVATGSNPTVRGIFVTTGSVATESYDAIVARATELQNAAKASVPVE
jgi:hypothetical protein